MRKIGFIQLGNGFAYSVYFDAKDPHCLPYKVFMEWNECTDHGLKHRKHLHGRFQRLPWAIQAISERATIEGV